MKTLEENNIVNTYLCKKYTEEIEISNIFNKNIIKIFFLIINKKNNVEKIFVTLFMWDFPPSLSRHHLQTNHEEEPVRIK